MLFFSMFSPTMAVLSPRFPALLAHLALNEYLWSVYYVPELFLSNGFLILHHRHRKVDTEGVDADPSSMVPESSPQPWHGCPFSWRSASRCWLMLV